MNNYIREIYIATGIGLFVGFCFLIHSMNCIHTGLDVFIFYIGFIGLTLAPVVIRKFQLCGGLDNGL